MSIAVGYVYITRVMLSLPDAKLKFSLHVPAYIQAQESQIRTHSQSCISNPTYTCGQIAICSYSGLEMAKVSAKKALV